MTLTINGVVVQGETADLALVLEQLMYAMGYVPTVIRKGVEGNDN